MQSGRLDSEEEGIGPAVFKQQSQTVSFSVLRATPAKSVKRAKIPATSARPIDPMQLVVSLHCCQLQGEGVDACLLVSAKHSLQKSSDTTAFLSAVASNIENFIAGLRVWRERAEVVFSFMDSTCTPEACKSLTGLIMQHFASGIPKPSGDVGAVFDHWTACGFLACMSHGLFASQQIFHDSKRQTLCLDQIERFCWVLFSGVG